MNRVCFERPLLAFALNDLFLQHGVLTFYSVVAVALSDLRVLVHGEERNVYWYSFMVTETF